MLLIGLAGVQTAQRSRLRAVVGGRDGSDGEDLCLPAQAVGGGGDGLGVEHADGRLAVSGSDLVAVGGHGGRLPRWAVENQSGSVASREIRLRLLLELSG